MPTGYTAKLYDGDPQSFEDFVWSCARGMGVCIKMREDPLNKRIPQKFEPNTSYYEESLKRNTDYLKKLENMSEEEIEKEANKDYENALDSVIKGKLKVAKIKARYEDMLSKVQAWEPPTTDHIGLKKFMIGQLEESIKFDCAIYRHDVTRLSGKEWLNQKISSTIDSIEYNKKHINEEIQRTNDRNRWLKTLRESVSQP